MTFSGLSSLITLYIKVFKSQLLHCGLGNPSLLCRQKLNKDFCITGLGWCQSFRISWILSHRLDHAMLLVSLSLHLRLAHAGQVWLYDIKLGKDCLLGWHKGLPIPLLPYFTRTCCSGDRVDVKLRLRQQIHLTQSVFRLDKLHSGAGWFHSIVHSFVLS